ncbi:hypothetical protein F2Q69_00007050 [Brassica cretica]|uniref:Uncharacterized protein n=1 Tax=Brassica cretica TaxID=69181 RepID=A0A8S9NX98_BRACR|nr:hypothetical protein F2Q69_00007050 [Brassica cretica]
MMRRPSMFKPPTREWPLCMTGLRPPFWRYLILLPTERRSRTGNQVTAYIGNEGVEKMVNADPPRLSADGDDATREQVEGAKE